MSKILTAKERVDIYNENVKREEAEWNKTLQDPNRWMEYECRLYRTYNYDDMVKRYGEERVHKDMDMYGAPRTIDESAISIPQGESHV